MDPYTSKYARISIAVFKIRPLRTDFELHKGKYVSLFDLYFELRSPLPFRYPAFFDFRAPGASYKASRTYEGFIKQNHKPVLSAYVKSGDKNIFMKETFNYTKQQSELYDDVYNQIYYRVELAKHFKPLFPGKPFDNPDKEYSYWQSKQYDGNDWHL